MQRYGASMHFYLVLQFYSLKTDEYLHKMVKTARNSTKQYSNFMVAVDLSKSRKSHSNKTISA